LMGVEDADNNGRIFFIATARIKKSIENKTHTYIHIHTQNK
jgi:hypothetical protein